MTIAGTTNSQSRKLNILSPLPKSYIKDGEVFIAVELIEDEYFQKQSLKLYLDEFLVNYQAKVQDKKVTVLYLDHLSEGKHNIRLESKSDQGELAPISWDFFIGDSARIVAKSKSNKDLMNQMANDTTKRQIKVGMTGFINVYSRNYDLSGPGVGLRQEPLFTRELNVNIEPYINKISFPIQAYYTTNDKQNAQPMNRFKVGIKSSRVEAYYGTSYPFYDNLITNGVRVDGGELVLKSRKLNLSVVYGELNKKIEGSLAKLESGSSNIPTNLNKDSTYVNPGVYSRWMAAGKLTIGRPEEGSIFGLSFMKAKDDMSSIKYGYQPKENIVFGADQDLISQNKLFRLNSGIALSVLTNDYSLGAINSDTISKLYGVDLPVNPSDFKGIITFNSSTVPIALQNRSSMAWYVKTGLYFRRNTIAVNYNRTGPGYNSFANPYMRNDLQEISLVDNLYLWKRKIVLQGRFTTNENNLYNTAATSIVNNIYFASLNFNPRFDLPSITFSYRMNQRTSEQSESFNYLAINDKIINLNAGFNYRASYLKNVTFLSLNYNNSSRVTNIKSSDSKTDVYTAYLQHDFPFHIGLNVQYSNFLITNQSGIVLQDVTSSTFGINFKFEKQKAFITISTGINNNQKTLYSNSSSRNSYNLNYRQNIYKGLSANFDFGISKYLDQASEFNNYQEKYANGGLTYSF